MVPQTVITGWNDTQISGDTWRIWVNQGVSLCLGQPKQMYEANQNQNMNYIGEL